LLSDNLAIMKLRLLELNSLYDLSVPTGNDSSL
jgi:hypothetical protein